MGEKRILDEKTRAELVGYVPFSSDVKIPYTPSAFDAVKNEELRPVFEVRSLNQSESIQLQVLSLKYVKSDNAEEATGLLEKSVNMLHSCVTGWKNLFNAATGEEIPYQQGEQAYSMLPLWVRRNISEYIKRISGVSEPERLSIK